MDVIELQPAVETKLDSLQISNDDNSHGKLEIIFIKSSIFFINIKTWRTQNFNFNLSKEKIKNVFIIISLIYLRILTFILTSNRD